MQGSASRSQAESQGESRRHNLRKYLTEPAQATRSGVHEWMESIVRNHGAEALGKHLHKIMPKAKWGEVRRLSNWARDAVHRVEQERMVEYQRRAGYRINR